MNTLEVSYSVHSNEEPYDTRIPTAARDYLLQL